MYRTLKYYLLLCAVFISSVGYSQTPVYAQVSSKKVQVGVPFEYVIVITVSANNYSPPSFKDFDIISGPNQSNSTQFSNGTWSSQTTLSWGLVAKKEGKFTIGPAVVNGGNQRHETNPVEIEAVKGAASPAQNKDELNKGVSVNDGDIFIKTVPTKTKLYLGEQLIVTHKLFSRLSLVGPRKQDPAEFEGFWTKRIELQGTYQQENIDGVVYLTGEYDKNLLFATTAGKHVIKSIQPVFVVRKLTNKKPRNILEQIFGGQQYEDIEVKVKSNPVTIEVLPLPEEGKPASFTGAVGKFNYKAEATKTTLKANEALNLKIVISGSGNLPLVDAPKLNLPEGLESYDPKITENGNSKTFDYLIIPRNEGNYELKDLDFSYFNPETKKYVTIDSPGIPLHVLPGDPNSTGAQVYTPLNTVKETENDIRYIKKGNFELIKSETEFFNSFSHFALMFGPIVLLIGGLVLRRNHIKNNSNAVLVKERKAAKIAKKQMVQAEKLMQQNKKDEFYTEILTAINSYLGSKFNIPVSDLSRDSIQKTLQQKNIGAEYIVKTLSTLDTAEYAKYAPGAVSGDLKKVYDETLALIVGLEEQLSKKG